MNRQSIGKEKAIALCETKWWIGKSHRDIAEFQMLTNELCCPFPVFHEAIEKALDRRVWKHELGLNNWYRICEELFNGAHAPSFEGIINLIPEEKLIIIGI
jgi:hypothetical protein